MAVAVRTQTPDDAPALAEVHVRAWQAAYRDEMPAAFLDGLDVAARTTAWTGWLSSPNPSGTILAGELDERVIGFAIAGARRADQVDDRRGGPGSEQHGDYDSELWALNVHPDAWRAGVGSALLVAAEAALVSAGHRSACLWVVTGNQRARRFYEAHGWRPDGGTRVEADGPADAPFDINETRYAKQLA